MSNFLSRSKLVKLAMPVLCSALLAFLVMPPKSVSAAPEGAVSADVSEDIGLVGNLFCVAGSDNADHGALQWATTLPADSFTLYINTAGKRI